MQLADKSLRKIVRDVTIQVCAAEAAGHEPAVIREAVRVALAPALEEYEANVVELEPGALRDPRIEALHKELLENVRRILRECRGIWEPVA